MSCRQHVLRLPPCVALLICCFAEVGSIASVMLLRYAMLRYATLSYAMLRYALQCCATWSKACTAWCRALGLLCAFMVRLRRRDFLLLWGLAKGSLWQGLPLLAWGSVKS